MTAWAMKWMAAFFLRGSSLHPPCILLTCYVLSPWAEPALWRNAADQVGKVHSSAAAIPLSCAEGKAQLDVLLCRRPCSRSELSLKQRTLEQGRSLVCPCRLGGAAAAGACCGSIPSLQNLHIPRRVTMHPSRNPPARPIRRDASAASVSPNNQVSRLCGLPDTTFCSRSRACPQPATDRR
jgi:hypothetical protein